MSLILKAFPMAFLISPDAKNKLVNDKLSLKVEKETLDLIKVATNLILEDINYLMENLSIHYKYVDDYYILDNGIKIHWRVYNGNYCAYLSLANAGYLSAKNMDPASYLVRSGEELMKMFEVMLKRNFREVGAKEIFYYCYQTSYNSKEDILALLYKNKIENILSKSDYEIKFRFNSKNYKFIRENKKDYFHLEAEQKIPLLNIVRGKKPYNIRALKTNFTDKDALIKTLEEYGATNIESDNYNIYCTVCDMKFLYSKNFSQGSYNLEINKISDDEKCTKVLNELEDEYGLNVQDIVYKKIIERIQSQNLRLESEEIGEDNSIVLTIDVG